MGRILSTTKNFRMLLLFMGILGGAIDVANAQVKIGNNPQTIDAGSILELESNE